MAEVRIEEATHWTPWRDLRLEALADTPIGFAEGYSDAISLTDAEWDERWARPGLRLIAFLEDLPVGMAGCFRRDDGTPVLFGVYLRPSVRGQGHLAELVDRVAQWAAPDPLVLDVHEDNARALAAYRKLGFRETGARTVGGGLDGRDLLELSRL